MQLLINALIAGSFAALIAGGLSLVYGVLRVFNLSLGQFALIGGYCCWWLYRVLDLPLFLSMLGALVIAGIVVWLCFELAVAPFYQRHRFLPLVTTLALSMILDGAIMMVFEEDPKSILGLKHPLKLGSAIISMEQLSLIILTLLILCGVAWLLNATPLGRKIRATVQHSFAARSLGIRSAVLHRVIFCFSGLLAALGGIYLGIDQNLTPVLGFSITIKAYAALIAGGKDSFWGTIVASYMIALLEQLAIGLPWFFGSYIAAGYQSSVALIAIMFFLIARPQGLFGSKFRTT